MHDDAPEDAAKGPKKTGEKKTSGKKAPPKSAAPSSEPTAPNDPAPAAAAAEDTSAPTSAAEQPVDEGPAAEASDTPPADGENRVTEKIDNGTPGAAETGPVESDTETADTAKADTAKADGAKADRGGVEAEKSAATPPPAPSAPEPQRIPPRDSGRSRRPHALPQRIEPTQTVKPKKSRKKLWGWLVGIVVLALLIAAAVVGFVLYDRHQEENSPETRIRATIDTFTTALESGDLATLRASSCGELATFYRDIPDAEFAEVHRVAVEQGNIPTVDAVDAINLESDTTAIAQVVAYTDANPDDRSPRTFDLSLEGEQWKVCSN